MEDLAQVTHITICAVYVLIDRRGLFSSDYRDDRSDDGDDEDVTKED